MYKQGDIVLIHFPFSDLSATKQRPVLILSNTTYNKSQSDLVVAAITSNLTSKTYTIQITADDLDEGQLRVTSAVRADKIYTFSNQIVLKKFGHLKPSIFTNVKLQLTHLLND
ncbi:type II toxin-antitoxin system PemK/MazF family toxin [Cohnella nanjingensis]|uniref:Type II toxin-antitoxin system PemK/MazF family toxin n=1 Tax=Cohnella nanjingensis TaxID=1387779 RepID=A0A7X0RM48_9BACL|nr:type II toxin-antitoxin system PemK/MazF family toxin [Cohnella nanjingensis]MBB6669992.1 type II toxin-antitoxin system PemK/MazF family toxin [Cohnella nanjingensis]